MSRIILAVALVTGLTVQTIQAEQIESFNKADMAYAFGESIIDQGSVLSQRELMETEAAGGIMKVIGNSVGWAWRTITGRSPQPQVYQPSISRIPSAPPQVHPQPSLPNQQLHNPNFVVTIKGTAYPVPKGATGPVPVTNGRGRVTGQAFTGGNGGKNGQVATIRIINSELQRGKNPGYAEGYIKYENKMTPPQGVDPRTGHTVSREQAHHPK